VEHYTTHNSTTRQLRPLFLDDPVGSSKQTMAAVCMCGLLHDTAQVIIEDEEEERLALTLSVESFAAGATTTRATTNTIMTATDCSNGFAGKYPCNNIDLIYHLPFSAVNHTFSAVNQATMGNDIWGWTHTSTEREFLIWGVNVGSYFVEITHAAAAPPNAAAAPTVVGFLPHSGESASSWHDIKVIDDYAYIGSEAKKHGMQIFDLTRLLNATENTQFDSDVIYRGTARSHNIVANPDTKYIYIVGSRDGSNTCSGGLHIVNVSDPTKPIFAGCYSADGYTHDAQCVVYNGPDTQYFGHEICFCFNQKFIAIVDVTDKSNIIPISQTEYTNNQYTHQGWLSSDMTHIVWGDEMDEIRNNYDKTTCTLILDITNLTDPTNFQQYFGKSTAIDHNQYITNAQEQGYGPAYTNSDLIYQSNYRAGLRILQVNNIDTDYGNATNIHEVGYFDTYPDDDNTNFNGAWSVFPYFNSGLVVISSIAEGLFVVKPNLATALTVPSPSTSPSADLSTNPSVVSSELPSFRPSSNLSDGPSVRPSDKPSNNPSNLPSSVLSFLPSSTASPTYLPSNLPSGLPSKFQSDIPSSEPSSSPSILPSYLSSHSPSMPPTLQPTADPTASPTYLPSHLPSGLPRKFQSGIPSSEPSSSPSILPSYLSSHSPSMPPTLQPTADLTASPTAQPSRTPTKQPSRPPTQSPTQNPTHQPTPTPAPVSQPTPSPINPPVCQNSKEIVYVNKKGKKKKCNWVKAGKKLKIRTKRCNNKKYSYLGKRIKKNCPKACGKYAGKGICKNLFVPPFGKNKSK